MGRFAGAALFVVLGAVGCSGTEERAAPSPSVPSARPTALPDLGPLGKAGCEPPSPIRDNEVQGTGNGAELRGLLFVRELPIRAGQEVKVVWRMTGAGDVRFRAVAPDGRAHAPVWGPEPHSGSSFERPGEEWGTGFRFTAPGCWHIRASRARGTADVWVRVARR